MEKNKMANFFKQAQERLKNKYNLDVIEDIVLGNSERVFLYADKSEENQITLHVISNSLKLIGLPNQQSITMNALMKLIDYDNKYAEVAGFLEYKSYIEKELLDFSKIMNITFPIKYDNQRVWIHFDGFKVEKNENVYAIFASNISELMEHEEALYEKTHKDSLTQLFNKYAFDYHYGLRYQMEHLHIIYIDIDDFKDINDQFSHHVGNEALKKLSSLLKQYETENNRFYRLGGDEFVGMFFDETEEVLSIAKDILMRTKQITLPQANKNFTISMGVIKATQREDLVSKADDLLYKAKNNGKDQIVFDIER
jgi:diguanylate cyclase (GGDEF)-like protein